MPLFPPPEPSVSCIDDLDFFKDFENEFPAIVYNDALTSKSDFSTEPTLCPQHIDEFDLNDETSLSEYDKVEQNVLCFNDIFHFNIIYPGDLKSDKDNDDNEIDMIQSSGDIAPLPPREQRHPFLMYQGLEYSDWDIADFEERIRMEHRDGDGVVVFTSQAWSRVFETRGPLVRELILEFLSTLRFGEVLLDLDAPGTIQFQLGGARRHFLGPLPSYTLIRDPVLRLCHRMMAHNIAGKSHAPEKVTVTDLFYLKGLDVRSVNIPYLLARYLRRFAAGRKSGALISGGQSVLSSETLGPGYPQDPLGRRVMQEEGKGNNAEELLRSARGNEEGGEEEMRRCPGLYHNRQDQDSMARDFSRFTTWTVTSLSRMMDKAGVTYTRYSESPVEYQRRNVRHRTDGASTSTAPHQPDP
ncbi:hypothetical protein Tco_0656227 [Tanacetum coccineum]|uniref:Uncharacterized protein n=1 Tax=Tanacetum coccineum TaxID=301880 RepID=A0ABQ4X8V2_9ASTR